VRDNLRKQDKDKGNGLRADTNTAGRDEAQPAAAVQGIDLAYESKRTRLGGVCVAVLRGSALVSTPKT
jgi:hypothetical protein